MECVDLKTHGMENFNVKVKCLIFTLSNLLACLTNCSTIHETNS